MRAGFFFASQHVDDLSLRDQSVVVIDVLRAGTTIATALANGAKEIIPVNTVERAVKISGSLFGDHILRGGERHGKRIEGFDLGNSPLEYSRDAVEGKAIIYSTTNGSRAIDKARYARLLVVGAFVNLGAIVSLLEDQKTDFVVLCSGSDGKFSLEDSVCGGMLLDRLAQSTDLSLSDAAEAGIALFKSFGKSVPKVVKGSEHGKYLAGIGFKEDLEYSSRTDLLNVAPQLIGSVVKLGPGKTRKTAGAKAAQTT